MIRFLTALALCAGMAAAQSRPEFEMTTYWVAFLKKGPAWTPQSTPETQKIQAGHMANIQKMAALGKLTLAGPFTAASGDLRGMFVFTAASLDEAKALAEDDPAVKSGRLMLEWHQWYSAKGIGIIPNSGNQTKGETK